MKPDDLIALGLHMIKTWSSSDVDGFKIDTTFGDDLVWKATVHTTNGTKELWLIDGDWVGREDIERW